MTVICKCDKCGFYQRGFCASPTTAINEFGTCSFLYKKQNGTIVRNGQALEEIADEFKNNIEIIEKEDN